QSPAASGRTIFQIIPLQATVRLDGADWVDDAERTDRIHSRTAHFWMARFWTARLSVIDCRINFHEMTAQGSILALLRELAPVLLTFLSAGRVPAFPPQSRLRVP